MSVGRAGRGATASLERGGDAGARSRAHRSAAPARASAHERLRGSRRLRLLVTVGLAVAIVFVDWLTPPGVVVAILLGIPIVLASVGDRPSEILLVSTVAAAGFFIERAVSAGPMFPAEVWLPNRILAFATIPAAGVLALLLQRQRLAADRARDEALRAGELSRLLLSLLAHDLRSPLATAIRTFEYVDGQLEGGNAVERQLLVDVQARLRRNLATIDHLVDVARAQLEGAAADASAVVSLRDALAQELAGFAQEATTRGKRLVADLSALGAGAYRVEERVLRQAVAIVVDNAIRHALPGEIRVRAVAEGGSVTVRVADPGPGLAAGSRRPTSGSGIGLQLCVALVGRVGGSLDVERDGADGTTFAIRVPAERVAG